MMDSKGISRTVQHRSWPISDSPWIMRQIWHELLFAQFGSLEHWLTERYCLYTVKPGEGVYRGDIHHIPWSLQLAELETKKDTMVVSHNIHLPDVSPLLHYSHRQEVLIWPLKHVL